MSSLRLMSLLLLTTSTVACTTAASPDDDGDAEPTSELTASGKADNGQSWCHANFTPSAGTTAVVDYEMNDAKGSDYEQTYKATSAWLNVSNPAFAEGDTAQAVFLVYEYAGACGSSCEQYGQITETRKVDMRYESGRLTAKLADLPIFDVPQGTDGSDTTGFFWQLAVVDNGNWYKDSSGNNFVYSPAEHSDGYCAQGHSI